MSIVSVTATITGANDAAYSYGTWQAQLVDSNGNSLSQATIGGTTIYQTQFSGNLSATGSLAVNLNTNADFTPTGTKWKFNICSASPNLNLPLNVTAQVCFSTSVTITGTGDISSTLSASAPAVYSFYPSLGIVSITGLSSVSTIYYLDGNRTDSYIENGSAAYPYKSLATLAAGVSVANTPFVIVAAPTATAYTYTGNISFPAQFMTIFGNGSTWAFTGNVTLNAAFHIENLFTTATGTLTYAATTGTESERIGGSLTITGGIFTSGYEHFFDMSILMNTLVTLNVGATPVFTNVVGTPLFKSATSATAATVLTVIDSESLATGAYTNVDMGNGGLAIIRGFIATNNGTAPNINLSGSSAVSATVANGLNGVEAAWVSAGSAYTYVAPDGVISLLSGTALHFLGPVELMVATQTNRNASITATSFYATTASGLYRVTASVQTTTAGSAGTVLVSVNGTSSAAASLTSLGATQSLSTTFYVAAGTNLQYTTTVASNTGGSYRVDAIVERVG